MLLKQIKDGIILLPCPLLQERTRCQCRRNCRDAQASSLLSQLRLSPLLLIVLELVAPSPASSSSSSSSSSSRLVLSLSSSIAIIVVVAVVVVIVVAHCNHCRCRPRCRPLRHHHQRLRHCRRRSRTSRHRRHRRPSRRPLRCHNLCCAIAINVIVIARRVIAIVVLESRNRYC